MDECINRGPAFCANMKKAARRPLALVLYYSRVRKSSTGSRAAPMAEAPTLWRQNRK